MTRKELCLAFMGLLEVAEIAMPATYYMSDTRVKRAKKIVAKLLKGEEVL